MGCYTAENAKVISEYNRHSEIFAAEDAVVDIEAIPTGRKASEDDSSIIRQSLPGYGWCIRCSE
jgi:hypothetical protein